MSEYFGEFLWYISSRSGRSLLDLLIFQSCIIQKLITYFTNYNKLVKSRKRLTNRPSNMLNIEQHKIFDCTSWFQRAQVNNYLPTISHPIVLHLKFRCVDRCLIIKSIVSSFKTLKIECIIMGDCKTYDVKYNQLSGNSLPVR